MQDPASELRRIHLLSTSVNKGRRKGRSYDAPASRYLPRVWSGRLVHGLDALALVLEAEFLVAAILALSLRLRGIAKRDEG